MSSAGLLLKPKIQILKIQIVNSLGPHQYVLSKYFFSNR